jgi:hypothetical protein
VIDREPDGCRRRRDVGQFCCGCICSRDVCRAVVEDAALATSPHATPRGPSVSARRAAARLSATVRFEISNAGRDEIVYGDLAGLSLALLALAAIRLGSTLWKPLTWLFVLATVADLGNALVVGLRADLFERASGVSWLILTFYVPALWLTTGLVVGQLVTRTEAGRSGRGVMDQTGANSNQLVRWLRQLEGFRQEIRLTRPSSPGTR